MRLWACRWHLNAFRVARSFLQISQCTWCGAGVGTSKGMSPAVTWPRENDAGACPFNVSSAPLFMPLRTAFFMTTSLLANLTQPSGTLGSPGGVAGFVGWDVDGTEAGWAGEGHERVTLRAMPITSAIPVASSSEDSPTSGGSSELSRYLSLYADMRTSQQMVTSLTRSFWQTENTSDHKRSNKRPGIYTQYSASDQVAWWTSWKMCMYPQFNCTGGSPATKQVTLSSQ